MESQSLRKAILVECRRRGWSVGKFGRRVFSMPDCSYKQWLAFQLIAGRILVVRQSCTEAHGLYGKRSERGLAAALGQFLGLSIEAVEAMSLADFEANKKRRRVCAA